MSPVNLERYKDAADWFDRSININPNNKDNTDITGVYPVGHF